MDLRADQHIPPVRQFQQSTFRGNGALHVVGNGLNVAIGIDQITAAKGSDGRVCVAHGVRAKGQGTISIGEMVLPVPGIRHNSCRRQVSRCIGAVIDDAAGRQFNSFICRRGRTMCHRTNPGKQQEDQGGKDREGNPCAFGKHFQSNHV